MNTNTRASQVKLYASFAGRAKKNTRASQVKLYASFAGKIDENLNQKGFLILKSEKKYASFAGKTVRELRR